MIWPVGLAAPDFGTKRLDHGCVGAVHVFGVARVGAVEADDGDVGFEAGEGDVGGCGAAAVREEKEGSFCDAGEALEDDGRAGTAVWHALDGWGVIVVVILGFAGAAAAAFVDRGAMV